MRTVTIPRRAMPVAHDRYEVISSAPFSDRISGLRRHLLDISESELGDDEANALIDAAYDYIEKDIRRPVVTQTIDFYWSSIPRSALIPQTPIQRIESVSVLDVDGVRSDVSSDDYTSFGIGDELKDYFDAEVHSKGDSINDYNGWSVSDGGTLVKHYDSPYPFVIRAVCGWQEDTLPNSLLYVVHTLAGDWFNNRSSSSDVQQFSNKHSVRDILKRWRRHNSGVW